MIKNYIKIAFRVMMRQKFFTAVSLFGISLTIMIISCITGMLNLNFGDVPPAVHRSRTLYFNGFTSTVNDKTVNPAPGPDFLNDVKKIAGVERVSMFATGQVSSLSNADKISFPVVFTDAELWKIYKFDFIEGRPFTSKEAAEGQSLVVITESVKRFYFGDEAAVGRDLPTKPKLKVIGVFRDFVSGHAATESSGLIIPLMRYKATTSANARYDGIILARNRTDIKSIQDQMLKIAGQKYNPSGGTVYMNAEDAYERMDFEGTMIFMSGFLLLLMIVPAMNMVGLNINRIAERSSEIGIRKSFGASASVLAGQFVAENLIITFLGAIIGLLLTFAFSDLIIGMLYSTDDVVPSGNFLVNWTVILYASAAAVFFGLLSGAIPAWRMSRLQIVKALKGGTQ